MRLNDVADWLNSLGVTVHPYMGKLANKDEMSIGVYHSKHTQNRRVALGGHQNETYGMLPVTFLIHGSSSLTETSAKARELYEALEAIRETAVNEECIKFVQLPYEIQDVGTDENGIFEQVIEAVMIFDRKDE